MTDNLAAQFLLDPAVTFLNHGSYGACPKPVFAAYHDWQLQLERQPVAFLDPMRGYGRWMRAAREALAAELGADPADLVGQMNATAALNIVAQSLPLREGDEILTTDHEYAALDKTWAYVARRTGARIVRVKVPLPLTSEAAFTETLLSGLGPRTRVLFLSHVTSATALLFPIARAVAEVRARGIWTVIDGAHAPGQIPLSLDALGADFYAGNCHKWMMAPKGAAFLHVRRDMQRLVNPLIISHGWSEDLHAPGTAGAFGNTPFIDSLEMQGTRDPAAFLTVPAALDFAHAHGWDEVRARCRDLIDRTEARVAALTGLAPFSTPQFRAPQMASMRIPRRDPRALQVMLLERHGIEIPCFDWEDNTIVRVSAQGYNTAAQMDLLVEALSAILT
ncbi:MAG: aminotransferase class V-fold PLP-dependent enzyme [Rubellimicrobium sp.]|nr:aminotransferase class V-fold PLP-dependent enzyme [Rubellimicrobium sp.]